MPKSHLKRYLIVGATSYAIEITTLYILHAVIGLSSEVSVAISFWVGFFTAFTLQKLITFQNHDKRITIMAGQITGYTLLVLLNYAITLLAVKFLSPHISVFIIRTAIILISTIWNFYAYKLLFKKPIEL
jgi:putative flippase GtrA